MPPTANLQVPTSGRIAFIGGGNMARSLIGGLVRSGTQPERIAVSEPARELRDALAQDFGISTYAANADAAHAAEVLVLAAKPQVLKTLCAELGAALAESRPLVISIAAGIRIDQIERWLGGNFPIVRSMPNTPALIGAGATGLCANPRVAAQHRQQCEAILGATGVTVWIEDEVQMDVVTALSGSGPAYFFALVEALEDAAVAQGLPRTTARTLATQTCLGAGRMLCEDGESPEQLRRRVTSPGGTTERALGVLADSGFRELIARMLTRAAERGRELSAQLDN